MSARIESVVDRWKQYLDYLYDKLAELGDQAHTNQYNLLATEALRLSICIFEVTEARLADAQDGDA